MKPSSRIRPLFWAIGIVILSLICGLVAVRIVNSMESHTDNIDFYNIWLGGHLVAFGGNPYDTTQWAAAYPPHTLDGALNPAFLYPLPLALFLAVFGWLPFHTAYIAWVTLLQLMIIISLGTVWLHMASPRARYLIIPFLAGIILFRPTTLTLTQGQVSALFLSILIGTALAWEGKRWFLGGVLLGLLALRPNLGFIILAFLSIWLLQKKGWSALMGIAASCLVLLAVGLIYDPHWVTEYLAIGGEKLTSTFGGAPTVWGLSALVCHNGKPCMLTVGGIATMAFIIAFLWLSYRYKSMRPTVAVALAIVVTLLVTPYTWTYDQLLLIIPIAVVTFALDRQSRSILPAGLLFPLLDVLVVVLLIFDELLQGEILNAFLPLVIFFLCVWCFTRSTKREASSILAEMSSQDAQNP
jgi:hypothetical protein